MIWIAVDAMGGDSAPGHVVDGALAAARLLEAEGFLVVPIRPPTVPVGTARLRFAFTARHDDDDIARLADLVRTRVAAAA